MGIKDFTAKDANFLILGKSADHNQSFYDQNILNGAKIIFTLKRKVAPPTGDKQSI